MSNERMTNKSVNKSKFNQSHQSSTDTLRTDHILSLIYTQASQSQTTIISIKKKTTDKLRNVEEADKGNKHDILNSYVL